MGVKHLLVVVPVMLGALAVSSTAHAEEPSLERSLPPSMQQLVEQLGDVAKQIDEGDPGADRGVARAARPVVTLMGPGVALPATRRPGSAVRFTLRPGSRGAWVRAGIRW